MEIRKIKIDWDKDLVAGYGGSTAYKLVRVLENSNTLYRYVCAPKSRKGDGINNKYVDEHGLDQGGVLVVKNKGVSHRVPRGANARRDEEIHKLWGAFSDLRRRVKHIEDRIGSPFPQHQQQSHHRADDRRRSNH